MEYWDILNKNGKKTGKILMRGEHLEDDEYHLVVNSWIKNSKGEFLISQRSANKAHPLMWECTGGSAVQGETSIDAAIREVFEEVGIVLNHSCARFLGRTHRYYVGCPDILDVWIFIKDIDIKDIKIQYEEVNDVKWATREEIIKLNNAGKFNANFLWKEIIDGKL